MQYLTILRPCQHGKRLWSYKVHTVERTQVDHSARSSLLVIGVLTLNHKPYPRDYDRGFVPDCYRSEFDRGSLIEKVFVT